MTRFARAKGSKSSNERVPEEATSWGVMKQQLLDKRKELEESRKRKDVLDQRNNNYKAFLNEKKFEELKETKWSEFPVATKSQVKKTEGKKNKARDNSLNGNIKSDSDDAEFSELKEKIDNVLRKQEKMQNRSDSDETQSSKVKTQKSKNKMLKIVVEKENTQQSVNKKRHMQDNSNDEKPKKIRKMNNSFSDAQSPGNEGEKIKSQVNADQKSKKNVSKKSKTKAKMVEVENSVVPDDSSSQEKIKPKKDKKKLTPNEPTSKHKITKKTNAVKSVKKPSRENLTEEELKKIEKKKQKKLKQLEKRKIKKAEQKQKEQELSEQSNLEGPAELNNDNSENKFFPKTVPKSAPKKPLKPGKIRDNLEHPRRKPYLPNTMIFNGKEIEVEYIEGFAVKKEDAIRIKKLRKEMIAKGLPQSEINHALKLERRKAEKAFSREKKKVCFNCRKSGHNLSECPELNKDQVAPTSGGGICYKCGSTEHTHFECKVVRAQNFNYATCFVCNEQGHIARQCPDNPKGLYPKGGACKVCGDVTHLKKDCPQYQAQQQKQEDSFKIGTYGDSNPDTLDDINNSTIHTANRSPNKIIKF